jgi:signal transduction histidine kinase
MLREAPVLERRIADVHSQWRQIADAEERVRREISELLHSRVQSRLLVVWQRLAGYEALLERDPAAAHRLVAEMRDEIERIRERDVRAASHRLHPSVVRIGLVAAIDALVEQFRPALEVELRVDELVRAIDDPVDNGFAEPVRLALYRALEEALANVVRHAGVARVDVDLVLADDTVRLTVRDRGRGFWPGVPRPGLGLRTVADRLAVLGGSLTVESAPGHGTLLIMRAPLAP